MSTSTLPFLYQTRTLSGLTWSRSSSVCRSFCKTTRRDFGASSRAQHVVGRASAPATTSSTERTTHEGGFTIRKTTNMSGAEPPSAGSWEFDPNKITFYKDELKSEGGLTIKRVKSSSLSRFDEAEEEDFDFPQTIEFDEDIGEEDEDIFGDRYEIRELPETPLGQDSTITPSERLAFQKIFSDIFERSKRSKSKKGDILSETSMEFDSRPVDLQNAESKLDNILTDALRQRLPRNREALEPAVNRYPPALQPAAARALGLVKEEAEIDNASSERTLNEDQLEALREPERLRVEGLMKAARTDFELWGVMEKEVFSLIPKLGLQDAPRDAEDLQTTKKKKKRRVRKSELETAVEKVHGKGDVQHMKLKEGNRPEDAVSPLALYGPLYPSYLLLGLRLLDRSFTKPSPLSLSLLPKIKSLGFISHVLGASTQFYNELLRILRFRHDDFRGMLRLLGEMDQSALDLDEETLDIVVDVMRTQLHIRRGDKGSAIQALWRMPEFAPGKFRAWRNKIGHALSDRELSRRVY